MSCIVAGGMSFYWRMVITTIIPPALIVVIFLWPLGCIMRRQPYLPAARSAGYLTLVGLEIITPTVLTTVLQTFVCEEIDGGWFLRAQLTLECDETGHRHAWQAYAAVCAVVYLAGAPYISLHVPMFALCVISRGSRCSYSASGVPVLFICLMHVHRNEIDRLQMALQEQDQDSTDPAFMTAGQLSKSGRRPSITTTVDEHLSWVVSHIENYRPGHWFTGAFLLLLRLSQTSVLVLIPTQNLQAAVASALAILGSCALREAKPFRRHSDNETAVVSQWCIFIWCDPASADFVVVVVLLRLPPGGVNATSSPAAQCLSAPPPVLSFRSSLPK